MLIRPVATLHRLNRVVDGPSDQWCSSSCHIVYWWRCCPLSEHILYSCAVPVLCTVQDLTSARVETPSSVISILYQGI